MFERLIARGAMLANSRRESFIETVLGLPAPSGVRVEAVANGFLLTGRGLKRRLIDDAVLRSFGR